MKLWILIILVFTSSLAFAVEFKTKKLSLGKQTLTVELAETEEQTAQGLMFRKELKEGTGMLFIFPSEELRSFWMKNTFVPLSIGFFNAKKELIDIQDMAPAASEMQTNFPSYQSKGPAQYALEVPKGWFAKHKIKLRDKFRLH
jgi:uncharacterized membrane protein (UPF0127 family)